MRFKSATKMGDELGLSYHKINKVLARNGLYDEATRRPTARALENHLAEIKSTTSSFSGKVVEFNVWNVDELKPLFPQPKKTKKSGPCQSPPEALDKVCDAFADFGHMLKIEVSNPKDGISTEAQSTVIEAYFGESSCLRGILLLHRFMRPNEAAAAKAVTLLLANELYVAAKEINVRRAQTNLRTIERTLQWLCDKAR